MTPDTYDNPERGRKQPAARTMRGEWVTIPNAHAFDETAAALNCDFGDGRSHPIAKSQIAPRSEVRHRGDRGNLIIAKWLALEARLMRFAQAQSPWARVPHTRQVLKELGVTLPLDNPERAIVKRIADALRRDLGIAPAGMGGSGGGKQGPNTTN